MSGSGIRGSSGGLRGSRSGRGPGGTAAARGRSGSAGAPAAPGHPEDDLGDPVAVAKAICLRLLTGAARSRADLAEALRRRGIDEDVAIAVLDRFTEVGLIDDEAYAHAFVRAKQRGRGLGRAQLQAELRRKGLDDEVVADAVAAIDPVAERGRAEALIARRVDAAMAAGRPAARRRLIGLLARRGYPSDVSTSVVDEALRAYEEVDEAAGW